MAQKVWVFSEYGLDDGDLSIENQVYDNFEQAEVAFNERMADICFYLEDNGISDEDSPIEYDEENHYWEMRHNDDIVCLLIEEQEVQS